MNNKELADSIMLHVGGKENVKHLTHCITRLRMTLHEQSKVNKESLKALTGVLGVAESNGQLQVVLGNRVGAVYSEIQDDKVSPDKNPKSDINNKQPIGTLFLDAISGIFSPIIPAIIGAGLLKGVIVLLTSYSLVSAGSENLTILNAIADGAFYFLPVLLGFSAAKKFGCNIYLGAVLGAILIHPGLIQLMSANPDLIYLFGIPIKSGIYMSSVLPVILSVWFMSYVERFLSRVLPSSLRAVFQPLLILAIVTPVMLALIAPLGAVIGKIIASAFMFMYFKADLVAGAVLGGLYPFVVLTGMHYGFLPIMFESISQTGFDYIMAIGIASNAAQGGAALAIFIRCKEPNFRAVAGAAAFNAVIGISEPALFGVTAKLKKPLIAVSLGGGLGGAYMSFYHVGATGIGTGPLAGLPFFFGPHFIQFIGGCIISFVVALLATYFMRLQDPLLMPK